MPPMRKRAGQREAAARALDALGRGADTGFRVARTLYDRWRGMSTASRKPLEPLAEDVRERALDLRGAADRPAADAGLKAANERLADAMVASAAADPDVSEIEVRDLRAELTRELERLAGAEIAASHGHGDGPDGPDGRPAGSPAPDARA